MAEDTGTRKDFSSGVGLDSLTMDRLHSEHPLMKIGMEKPKKPEEGKTVPPKMGPHWGDNLR